MHTVEAADSSTPLRSAQNDSAHLTFDLEVTHDVKIIAIRKNLLDRGLKHAAMTMVTGTSQRTTTGGRPYNSHSWMQPVGRTRQKGSLAHRGQPEHNHKQARQAKTKSPVWWTSVFKKIEIKLDNL